MEIDYKAIINNLPMRQIDIAIYIGISRATLWEKKKTGKFTEQEKEKILELEEMYKEKENE